jgi:dTDP-glucose pyrophosphorylase
MNNKPTLLVLAAGMGSRYGGLKQMDAFGPNGETIIDYSLHDAIDAGFGKIVFIVRASFIEAFKEKFDAKLAGKIDVAYVCQELDVLPKGINPNPNRTKPWGTGHAVWVGKEEINGPFGVINSDDFYGRESYFQLADFLKTNNGSDYCLIGYKLINTLSDHGTVNRGVCSVVNDKLSNIKECIKIGINNGEISYPNPDGSNTTLSPDTLVSMNMWGFKDSFFDFTEEMLHSFFKNDQIDDKSELYIPNVVDHLIQHQILNVEVISTNATWFGVTYPEDKPMVISALKKLIKEGVYAENLWN